MLSRNKIFLIIGSIASFLAYASFYYLWSLKFSPIIYNRALYILLFLSIFITFSTIGKMENNVNLKYLIFLPTSFLFKFLLLTTIVNIFFDNIIETKYTAFCIILSVGATYICYLYKNIHNNNE